MSNKFSNLAMWCFVWSMVVNVCVVVFVLAAVDFFIVSVTMFTTPGAVMVWCVGIVIGSAAILAFTTYKSLGNDSPRRNKWQ